MFCFLFINEKQNTVLSISPYTPSYPPRLRRSRRSLSPGMTFANQIDRTHENFEY
jgi:hypothetical protein